MRKIIKNSKYPGFVLHCNEELVLDSGKTLDEFEILISEVFCRPCVIQPAHILLGAATASVVLTRMRRLMARDESLRPSVCARGTGNWEAGDA